jgi:hypothetical protein
MTLHVSQSVREAKAGRADNAAFLHSRLEVARSRPCVSFEHIRDIFKDHNVIRIVGIAEHPAIGNARGMTALFAAVVARTPHIVILDLVPNCKVLGLVLRIHIGFSEIAKIQIRMIMIQIMDGMWESAFRYQAAKNKKANCTRSVILTSQIILGMMSVGCREMRRKP